MEKVGRLLLDLRITRTFKKSSKSGDFAEQGLLLDLHFTRTFKKSSKSGDFEERVFYWR